MHNSMRGVAVLFLALACAVAQEGKKAEEKEKLEKVLKGKWPCRVDMSIRIGGIPPDPNWHDLPGTVTFESAKDGKVAGSYEHAPPLKAKGMLTGTFEGALKGDTLEGHFMAKDGLKQKVVWKFTRDKDGKVTGATGTWVQPLGFSQKWDLKRPKPDA